MHDYEKTVRTLREYHAGDPELPGTDPDAREAEIFRRILAGLPIHRRGPEDRLAGEYGLASDGFAGPAAATRKPVAAEPSSIPAPDTTGEMLYRMGCWAKLSANHVTLDFEYLLRKGLRGAIEEADDPARTVALLAVIDFAHRYADLGFSACHRVPEHPAETFAEALQSVLLAWTVVGIAEGSYASTSLGRVDQYLWPYYLRDRERGIPEAELESWLESFFDIVSRYGDGAGAVNLGGLDERGDDAFNDLTRIMARVLTRLRRPGPLIAVRCHRHMRDGDLALLARPELFALGQPTFYGEETARAALRRRGVPEEDINRWVVNSCMGLMVAGREFADMWAVVMNVLPGLEAALNGGVAFTPFPLRVDAPANPDDYGSLDELIETMFAYNEALLRLLIERHAHFTATAFETDEYAHSFGAWAIRPDPYVSALLSGGRPDADRLRGGPRYHTANVNLFGVANAGDALVVLDELVFRRKRCTIGELADAAKNDWRGSETLRREAMACPKFGEGDARADAFAARVAEGLADRIERLGRGRPIIYMPSFHTLNVNVPLARDYPASVDGRRAGEPFAKNIGPTPGRNRMGLTALMRSACAVEQTRFYGGQALDVHLDRSCLDTPEALEKVRHAVLAYFAMGGMELQINAASVADLEDALIHPERHEDLTVRIGGYSHRFNRLGESQKREMIERFRHGT